MWLWDIINKTMCKSFMSCEVTLGMICRAASAAFITAVMINILGGVSLILLGIYPAIHIVVISGIIAMVLLIIAIICTAFILDYIPSYRKVSKVMNIHILTYRTNKNLLCRLNNAICYIYNSRLLTIGEFIETSIYYIVYIVYSFWLALLYLIETNNELVAVNISIVMVIILVAYLVVRKVKRMTMVKYRKIELNVLFRCKKKKSAEG